VQKRQAGFMSAQFTGVRNLKVMATFGLRLFVQPPARVQSETNIHAWVFCTVSGVASVLMWQYISAQQIANKHWNQ
jgi:uncharacterized membrane protein